MKRLLPVIVIAAVALCALATAQPDKRQQAWDLVQAGHALLLKGAYPEAERKLLEARDLDPRYPDSYSNLGYLYYKTGDVSKAIDCYGQFLTLRPEDPEGRRALKTLFFEGQFPRAIRAPYLAFSGVGFTNEQVRVLTPEGEATRHLAYTTSLLFHEDMKRGQGPISIPLPVSGSQVNALVNRSCYGYTMAADSDRYALAFALSYPSELLPPGRSFASLATNLTHLLLRFATYQRVYLGAAHDLPESTVVKAYLCTGGPTGAESYKGSIYFDDIATDRASVEWARQAAHELGHMYLPPVGRFVRPEAYANGYLGERLLMQYLALEAGLVAGEPWPSPAAQQAVNALWPGEDFKLAGYITASCRPSLDYFLASGPDSPLAAGPDAPGGAGSGEAGMQFYCGAMLWTQAAFGPELLRQVLQTSSGETVAPAEGLNHLKALLTKAAQKGTLELLAGSINVASSQLATKPLEGALGRTLVQLAPGDSATFTMYLPAGAWSVQTGPQAADLTLTIDGKGPLPFTDGAVSLGRMEAGWHSLTLKAGEKTPPFTLEKLIFKVEKEA